MFGLRTSELLLILLVVLVLFGPKALPQLGHSLGEGLRSFRKATSKKDEEEKPPTDGPTHPK